MNDYILSVINDNGFYSVVVVFSGLYMSVFLVGYFISLLISLFNKIIRS